MVIHHALQQREAGLQSHSHGSAPTSCMTIFNVCDIIYVVGEPSMQLPTLAAIDVVCVCVCVLPAGNVQLVQAAVSSSCGACSITYYPNMPGNSTLRPVEKQQLQGAITPQK